jgi:hypothetical protein
MSNLSRQTNLVEDKRPPLRARQVNQFQGNRGLEHEIIGAPDVAHSAPSETCDHPVTAGEDFARRKPLRGPFHRATYITCLFILMKRQQRFDLLSQVSIAFIGMLEEGFSLSSRTRQRSKKDRFRARVD